MYTLRIIRKDGLESNQYLGEDYSISYRDVHEGYEEVAKKAVTNKDTYAIIISNGGSIVFPLFRGNKYFIMSENGKTIDNLTNR